MASVALMNEFIALTIIADGDVDKAELAVLDELAEADGHIAQGESIVLVAAVEHWGLHRQILRVSEVGSSLWGDTHSHLASGIGHRFNVE